MYHDREWFIIRRSMFAPRAGAGIATEGQPRCLRRPVNSFHWRVGEFAGTLRPLVKLLAAVGSPKMSRRGTLAEAGLIKLSNP